MDEQSIVNFLRTLETDTTLPKPQKVKLIKSALNVTNSSASSAGGDSSTASVLLKQALEKFSIEPADRYRGKEDKPGKHSKSRAAGSSKFSSGIGDQKASKVMVKIDAGCSPRESLLQKARESRWNAFGAQQDQGRKMNAVNSHLQTVSDMFHDVKMIAQRRSDVELQQFLQELEDAVSMLPAIVDKKMFDHEMRFSVGPLQKQNEDLKREIQKLAEEMEQMEMLHKEMMESKKREILALKETHKEQAGSEKILINKLKASKHILEGDCDRLNAEINQLEKQVFEQKKHIQECSRSFNDELKSIRAEIDVALAEVQKQKAKLNAAERESDAKDDQIKGLKEFINKQQRQLNDAHKEIQLFREQFANQSSTTMGDESMMEYVQQQQPPARMPPPQVRGVYGQPTVAVHVAPVAQPRNPPKLAHNSAVTTSSAAVPTRAPPANSSSSYGQQPRSKTPNQQHHQHQHQHESRPQHNHSHAHSHSRPRSRSRSKTPPKNMKSSMKQHELPAGSFISSTQMESPPEEDRVTATVCSTQQPQKQVQEKVHIVNTPMGNYRVVGGGKVEIADRYEYPTILKYHHSHPKPTSVVYNTAGSSSADVQNNISFNNEEVNAAAEPAANQKGSSYSYASVINQSSTPGFNKPAIVPNKPLYLQQSNETPSTLPGMYSGFSSYYRKPYYQSSVTGLGDITNSTASILGKHSMYNNYMPPPMGDIPSMASMVSTTAAATYPDLKSKSILDKYRNPVKEADNSLSDFNEQGDASIKELKHLIARNPHAYATANTTSIDNRASSSNGPNNFMGSIPEESSYSAANENSVPAIPSIASSGRRTPEGRAYVTSEIPLGASSSSGPMSQSRTHKRLGLCNSFPGICEEGELKNVTESQPTPVAPRNPNFIPNPFSNSGKGATGNHVDIPELDLRATGGSTDTGMSQNNDKVQADLKALDKDIMKLQNSIHTLLTTAQ